MEASKLSFVEVTENFRNKADVLKLYNAFEAPNGKWTGELDFTLERPCGCYCYFTAIKPDRISGKKFRLYAREKNGYKIGSDSPNMREILSGIFQLETAPPPSGSIVPAWEKAVQVK